MRIVEAYGAIDGGGFVTANFGNAPVGSIGRPLSATRYRLVNSDGQDVVEGETGELWTATRSGSSQPVEYYCDEQATRDKSAGGWLRSGDLLYRDKRGFLYFAGRNSDSMRRRGENVSAYEVESVIEQHPDVLECAVFGVPSELGEEDIMAAVVPLAGRTIDPAELRASLQDKLARHALSRYLEVLAELPKTATHRVQKNVLKQRGPSEQSYDAERANHERESK